MKWIAASFSFVLVSGFSHADISTPLNIRTEDGTVSNYPYQVRFTNGDLTDHNDGTMSVSIPAGGGGGSSALAISSGGVNASVIITSPTANVVFDSNTFVANQVNTSTPIIYVSSNTVLYTSSAAATYLQSSSATATYLQNSSATATYLQDSSATATYLQQSSATATYLQQSSATATYLQLSSATATYLQQSSAAVTYANLKSTETFTAGQTFTSSITVTGNGGITSTFGVKAATAQITGLGTNTNICTDGSSNLTTTACNNGTITGVTAGTGLTGGGASGNVTVTVASTGAFTTSTETFTAAQQFVSSVTFSSNTFQRDGIYITTNGIVNANYTSKTTDNIILASATPAGITVTLNFSTNSVGQTVEIMKVSQDTFTINIAVSGKDLIDGTTGLMQISAYTQADTFYSVGMLNGGGVWIGDKLQITPQFAGPQAGAPSSSQNVGTSSTTYIQAFYTPIPINIIELDIPINTQSGNLDLGIYNSSGTLLFHTGNVAMASPGLQTQSVNAGVGINLAPGYYYFGLVVNNITALLGRYSGYNNTPACKSFSGTTTVLANVNVNGGTLGNQCFMIWGKVAGGASF